MNTAAKHLAELEPLFALLLQKLGGAASPIGGGGVRLAITKVTEARAHARAELRDEATRQPKIGAGGIPAGTQPIDWMVG